MDKLKYNIYSTLWAWWHMWLRQYYDDVYYNGYPYRVSRPWWHMCCNGDAGGWRTHLCNHLEYKWRSTKYYSNGEC